MLLHSARNADDVIFGDELRELARSDDGFRLHEQHTGEHGRIAPADLERLCPDWSEREAFISGPGELLDALDEHWDEHGDCDRLHMERFQPMLGEAEEGEGGTISFLKSRLRGATATARKPILVAGEEAGLELPFGCREGICHTCVGTLRVGRGPRPAHRQGLRQARARRSAPASTPPRGPVEIEL